jgi:hypothetical protein
MKTQTKVRRRLAMLGIALACALLLWGDQARAGILLADIGDSGGGPYFNLIVREVRVTPVRAHVGDVVRIDVVIEDQGDVRYAKGDLEIKVNGRKVAGKRLGDDIFGGEGERIYQHSLEWDTRGVKPGQYRLRAEFFVWGDASEFDNFLDLKEPVILQAPGEPFGDGLGGGGTAISRDPRYRPGPPARNP